MRTKRIGKWLLEPELRMHLNNAEDLSWLLEDGSITQKISGMAIFQLEIIRDQLGLASMNEYWALGLFPQPVRVREVILWQGRQRVRQRQRWRWRWRKIVVRSSQSWIHLEGIHLNDPETDPRTCGSLNSRGWLP